MPSQKSIPISELITTANSELLRLDFKRSALQIYCAEFRKFSDYYSNEKIQDYTATTGREYFQSIYGVNIASPRLQLTKSQSATRRAIRLLDDIFQFGYALRYCHRSYTVNPEYDILLESYLMKCRKKHNSQGTLRTKQMKLCQFFEYALLVIIDGSQHRVDGGRGIALFGQAIPPGCNGLAGRDVPCPGIGKKAGQGFGVLLDGGGAVLPVGQPGLIGVKNR